MILAKIPAWSCQDLSWFFFIHISCWAVFFDIHKYRYNEPWSNLSHISQYCQYSIIILPWSWTILPRFHHDLAKILSILILEVLDTISSHDLTMIIPKMSWFWKILVKGGFLRAQIALAPLRARSKWLKWDQLINICKSCYLRIFRIFVVDNRW